MAMNKISETLRASMLLLVAFSAITSTIIEAAVCSETMASSLSASGFRTFALALHTHNITASSSSNHLTYLAPPDSSLQGKPLDGDAVLRHVTVAGALPYQTLLALPKGTTFQTLHHNATLLVDADGDNLFFNQVHVTVPDLYFDGSCAVHGVDGPLIPISSASLADLHQARIKASPSPEPRRRHYARLVRFIRRGHSRSGVH